jgi:hypothetical protein
MVTLKRSITISAKALIPVIAGLTLWIAYQFVVGGLPHPMSSFGNHDLFALYTARPIFETDSLSFLYKFPAYYLSGVLIYLVAGLALTQAFALIVDVTELGFIETIAEYKRQAAQARRDAFHAKRRKDRKLAEQAKEAVGKNTDEWSLWAIIFGVFLGWLIFAR